MRILLCSLALSVALLILWSIGSLLRRFTGSPRGRWAATCGVGLAGLVFAGGIANLLHIAYRPAMWALIALCAGLAAWELTRGGFAAASARRRLGQALQDGAGRAELAVAAVVITAALLFTISTQLPPGEFNFHDDLQKYFAHPVRMLETGTLAGSPLSALGSETLGGQAFLQGLVLAVAGTRHISYINGVDAVMGLLLLLLLAAAAGWRRFGWFPGAAMGALLVALVNPQYVNVSGLYLGAALMATAILLTADEGEESASPVLLGVVYAGMIALKPTFGAFAAAHWAFSIPEWRLLAGEWKAALARAGRVVLCGGAAVAPWFLIHAANYFARGGAGGTAVPNGSDLAGANLLSTERLYDGDSVASYTALAGLTAFVGVLALAAWWTGRADEKRSARALRVFAGAASGVASFLIVIFYLGIYAGYQQSVRYVTPFVLGACVVPALLAPTLMGKIPRAASTLLPALATLAVAGSFVPAAAERAHQAERFGSILAFAPLAESPPYRPYIQASLSDQARARVEKLQSNVPAGEPILAWINTPYWLDYGRNRIVDVDTAGIASPWARFPQEVHYVLWQYKGYATRTPADYRERMHVPGARERLIAQESLAFADHITDLANTSPVVTSDDEFVLFRVDAEKK